MIHPDRHVFLMPVEAEEETCTVQVRGQEHPELRTRNLNLRTRTSVV